MEITIESIVERWNGLDRPLFRGELIDENGCKCAQGDVLSCAGYSDDQLRRMEQSEADTETARILGISQTHAVLLRQVNDSVGGAPQLVLSDPAAILGDKAPLLLAFWLHLDLMDAQAWATAGAQAWAAAREAAGAGAWTGARTGNWAGNRTAAREAAREAAGEDAWARAWDAAGAAAGASSEIQGMDILEKDGKQPYFLTFFGFKTWDDVRALVGSK